MTLEPSTPQITLISNSSVSCAYSCHFIDTWSRNQTQNRRGQLSSSVLELKPQICCIKLVGVRLINWLISWSLYLGTS